MNISISDTFPYAAQQGQKRQERSTKTCVAAVVEFGQATEGG